jgi:DNA-binding CsgD family transcriptional regulator
MLNTDDGSVRLFESREPRRAVDQVPLPLAAPTHVSVEMEPGDADEHLFAAFARARRRFRGAIVAVSDRTMITNAAASELLQPVDRRRLCQWMLSSGPGSIQPEVIFDLANGVAVRARSYPVEWAGRVVGVVLHLSGARLPAGDATEVWTEGPSCRDDPDSSVVAGLDPALLAGWSELTDSERTVAELVGQGLSNREAGRRLFLSRHTVDYHLRRVFRKLGIKSRVELARVLGEHYESLLSAVADQKIA